MAYNQGNLLDKIEKVQKIYSEYTLQGVTAQYIYDNHIKEPFNISIRTFYNFLKRNVAKERRILKEKQGEQLKLFGE